VRKTNILCNGKSQSTHQLNSAIWLGGRVYGTETKKIDESNPESHPEFKRD
jgi:hypothetical protein